jgi:hypothetical protein
MRPPGREDCACRRQQLRNQEGTSEVDGTGAAKRVKVTGDGKGVAGHAGARC